MKKPKIRFNGYTDEWEQRKFGELIDERRDKTTEENEDVLLSCAIEGIYLNSELFSHFRGSSNKGYLKIKKNDMILSAQNLHLGNCNINMRFEHGIISPAYKVYQLVSCNPEFMQAWIKGDTTKNFFLRATTEGASVCRKNIIWSELYKQELQVPRLEEQAKIGCLFSKLDNLINLHQRKCDEVKTLKKYMLQKMFPQNGKNVPEIRFKGFTDAWEQRKVSDILKDSSNAIKIGPFGSALKKEFFVERGVKVYAQENIFADDFTIGTYYITEEKYNELKSCELVPGDLVISMMGTIGTCAIFPANAAKGIMNSHLLRLQFEASTLPKYIMYLLRDSEQIRNQVDRLSVGSIMSGLSSSVVKKLIFSIPSLEEQRKIVDYYDHIDNLITLHQRKCDELKNIKKYMLQNMFV